MSLLDRLRRRPVVPDDDDRPMPGFTVDPGETTRFVTSPDLLAVMQTGRAQRTPQLQYLVLDMLAEAGRAVLLPDGFEVSADDVAGLDEADARALGLPPRYPGTLEAHARKWTADPEFTVRLVARAGAHPEPHQRLGPVLTVGSAPFLLTQPQLRALRAVEQHDALPRERRSETAAVRLVAHLRAAERMAANADDAASRDFRLDLGALPKFTPVMPTSVGVTVTPLTDGSLDVEPDLGPAVNRELLSRRWSQVDRYAGQDAGVLRVGEQVVLLENEQLRGVAEVRRRPTIPAEQVPLFYAAPGSFYDPDLVDVDVHLSMRVVGLGLVAQVSYASAPRESQEWIPRARLASPEQVAAHATTPAQFEELAKAISEASERGESTVIHGDSMIDVPPPGVVEQFLEVSRRLAEDLERERQAEADTPTDAGAAADAGDPAGREIVDAPQDNVESDAPSLAGADDVPEHSSEATPDADGAHGERGSAHRVGWVMRDVDPSAERLRQVAESARPTVPIDWTAVRRTPFPHQRDGVEWITGLAQAALAAPQDSRERVRGALLADDMGLGKTFMTLVALGEIVRAQRAAGTDPLPMLAVMPVALLENWSDEIVSTFGSAHGPFDDVVVLHAEGIERFRAGRSRTETAVAAEDLDADGMVREDRIPALASLKVGEKRWGEQRLDRQGVLVLTTYETLRRYQVSLALVDWGVVVMDEAQWTKNPDILLTRAAKALQSRFTLLATGTPVENSLQDFWCLVDTAQPGLLGTWAQFRENWEAPLAKAIGEEHARLGRGLRATVGPFMLRRVKEDYLPDLPTKTIKRYPHTMPQVQVAAYDDAIADFRAKNKGALATLNRLRDISLHPWVGSGQLCGEPTEAHHSARTIMAIQPILDGIRDRDEKAIVFVERKELQKALALWLVARYGIWAETVNGDTAATRQPTGRLERIRRFEGRDGFNVILMSPKAVGVGLTVVGANHAIHLERLWNPAKEAQATDRIHRIGQTRPVFVHYPMAIHPDHDSFDVNLDRLLASKVALKDVVVVPQEVSPADLERSLGLR